ncbi:putative LRR receptor-like serine/threonine-protein kinase [Ananas comosus]|uniref:non-specific serine/threonine protein kinase n=1 Tax=Ananas comosus TaxID=4615 RepID=A0A199VKS0_ANACO|nr:putative LRR receptor-like serine/threonine-protein kinase [Ananas comosus]
MPNGSLEDWLHHEASSQAESKHLSLLQRLNIAIDVASALDYLHCHSGTPIVHRDLKPNNVLLDDDMVAHVGDFGLARFRTAQKSASSIGFKGSIGYVAPVSAHGDIYSFGILLMEMMTGRRPTDNIFKEDLSLHRYVEIAFPDRVIEIVDARLLAELADDEDEAFEEEESTGRKAFQCIVSLLRVGLMCSKQFPTERMLIGDVIKELHVVREMLLGKKDV